MPHHKCDKCGRVYSRLDGLRAHLRGHLTANAYECKECNRTFKHVTSLARHQRLEHHSGKIVHQEVLREAYQQLEDAASSFTAFEERQPSADASDSVSQTSFQQVSTSGVLRDESLQRLQQHPSAPQLLAAHQAQVAQFLSRRQQLDNLTAMMTAAGIPVAQQNETLPQSLRQSRLASFLHPAPLPTQAASSLQLGSRALSTNMTLPWQQPLEQVVTTTSSFPHSAAPLAFPPNIASTSSGPLMIPPSMMAQITPRHSHAPAPLTRAPTFTGSFTPFQSLSRLLSIANQQPDVTMPNRPSPLPVSLSAALSTTDSLQFASESLSDLLGDGNASQSHPFWHNP
eukprot:TRINITY_DN4905_c0_g1_i1.p1 TRINITY_DN4905_c0_g1~~TRINITY_DN4905_c0_g1_i1.p1  ORF type:complete len:342 (+),score=35.69 TRINITY_DN4905_c0_g1_i1:93-1118(+)